MSTPFDASVESKRFAAVAADSAVSQAWLYNLTKQLTSWLKLSAMNKTQLGATLIPSK